VNNKGRIGNDMNVIISGIKTDRIKSTCTKCIHYRKNKGIGYCDYYLEVEPTRKKCARFGSAGKYGKKIKNPRDRKCKNRSLREIRNYIRNDENGAEKIKKNWCDGCKQNKKGRCKIFGNKKIDDLGSF